MNKKHIFKRVTAFIIVLISVITLSACKKQKLVIPYGSLDDSTYLSGEGFKITKKELYKEMRVSDLSVLEKMIYEIVFAEEIDHVKNNKENFIDDFIDIANDKIFYTDEIEDLKEYRDSDLRHFVAKFVDLLYLEGVVITPADVDVVEFKDHSQVIFDHYILDVAQKHYARTKLNEEVLDEDSDYFIDKGSELESYFKNQVKKRYPLSSINIRFTNSYEANQTLRHFNLKTYRSRWYEIKDPRVEVVTGYPLEILESLDLEDKNGSLSESEHQLYYDKYVIDPTREPTEDADVSLTTDEAMATFFRIYNFVYPYKEQIDPSLYPTVQDVLDDETLVNDDEEAKGIFTKFYDDYPSPQSSLRTYIYDTLKTGEEDTRYTASPRSYGNYYFITFKLQDHNDDLLSYVNEDDELIVWADEEETTLTDYAQEYFEELVKNMLSSSYITGKADEKLKEAKIVIYDNLVHLSLNQRDIKNTLSKKPSKTLVGKVGDVEITVDELYALLEEKLGPSISMDLAIKQLLEKSSYMDEITKDKRAQYKENVEQAIRQFSQNDYADSGLPASIGRKAFLQLSFKSDSIEEAIQKVYVHSELERLFYEDYERHYGEDIYQMFTDYANKLREQYFSITTSHLLIYVDMDEDDQPDKPEEFFETLTEVQIAEYKEMVTDLMKLIHDRASKHSKFEDGLRSVVNDFNDSTKFRTDACDANDGIEYRPECTWAKYKQYGFFLKFEELGETVNSTNYPDKDGGLDDEFFDRLQILYDEVYEEYYETDKKFPTQILDSKPIDYDGDENSCGVLESAFGWHLILVTGGEVAKSAKFEYDKDTYIKEGDTTTDVKLYEKIIVKNRDGEEITVNAYSEDDEFSVNQIRIFVYESGTNRGVVSLPNEVLEALNDYFLPIKEKYNNNYMKMYLLYKMFSESNFEFASPSSKAKLDGILEINVRQFLDYSEDDELFLDIYGDWFDIFE